MTRPEITAELSAMLEKKINPHNDPRIYWAKEVTFDYSTDHAVRVDYMRFVPVNNSVSGIEKGDCYCYEIKSSVEDFHSGHGLNFIGDYNYLVLPGTVCAIISLEIPHDVGIYIAEGNELACIKKAKRRNRTRPVSEILLMMFRSANRDYRKAVKQLEEMKKDGLSYDVAENNIKDRIRDWVVSRPETGFLFPVFNDRSTDIHGTLYFNKNIKNIHPDFIENVLGAPIPRIPGNEINVFSDFIMDNFEGNTTFNFAESLVESLQEVREQKKDSPEMVTVSCDEMEQIFGYCGVPDEKLSDFKENWEMYFSNEPVALDNIHNSKTAKIVTPDATICIQPDKIALIELKEINGVPSLVIPVNGELKINGIEVGLK